MNEILEQIKQERERQDAKWGEQNHPMVSPNLDSEDIISYSQSADMARKMCDKMFEHGVGSWEDILNEEYQEAFEQAAQGNKEAFREELIQVAAVVVAMIQCLDRNGL